MQGQEKQSISKVKQKWFDFTMQLVSNDVHIHLQKLSMNVYIFFIIIESLQFIGYHNNGLINYRAFGFDYLGNLLKYLNFLPLMINQNINLILVPFFTVLIIIHMTLIAVGFHTYHKKMEKLSKSVDDRDFRKSKLEYFINFLMVSFSTFLTIPICQTSVLSIYCQSEAPFTKIQNCYSSTQICIVILAFINIIWLIVINLYFSLYYYNRNPFSTNFLTCSSNWWSLGKFAIKIIPIFYFSYDPYLAYPVLFLIMINGSYAGYIVMFRILFPFYRYNFHLQKTVFFIQIMTLFTDIGFAVIYSFNTAFSQKGKYGNNIFFVLWIVASLMFSKLALDYFVRIKKKLIVDVHSVEKIKLENVLEYLVYLIFQTEKNLNENKGGFFVGNIAKTHKDICEKTDCYCKIYFKRARDKDYDKNKQVFYTLILAIIDRVMQQNRRVTSFFILKAYILFYKMQSQIKAATTIATIMMDKLDFSDQMLVKGLLFQLNNQYTDTRDMQIYRKFNQYLLHQEEESMKLVNFYIQYWEQLIDQSSSIPKLYKILNLIKLSKQKLNYVVQTSLGIYRNHVRVLLLYKNFLKEVLNDYVGYLRYEQKYKVGLKEHKLTNVDAVNTIQFRPNQNLVVINFTRRFSTHTQIMGNFQILNISSNVKEVLGFTNVELKDQSLNKMIPRIYHAIHDTFIDQILDKKDAEIVSYQYRIFPLNSEGHIVQCNIISKFMPSVSCGINIVSFIQQCDKYKDEFFIIYDKNNGIVDAMNETAQKMLKDVSRRKSNDMMSIPDHINDLIPHWDYKNQIWRERIGRGKSMKSIGSGSELKYELKSIQIVRSDGLQVKNIKILKFKGDFFMKMFSFDNNYESYKQSNTIQQYLQYQKNSNTFSKMDSNQLQDLISANDTHHLIERGRQMKKTMHKLQKKQKQKTRQLRIQSSPPKLSKIIFIVIQSFLFCFAIGITIYQAVITNNNINSYIRDSDLLINVNSIQFLLSDTTFVLSIMTTEMAYNSNMSLPYTNFQSSVQLQTQLEEMHEKLQDLKKLTKIIDPIFVQKINNKQLSYSSLIVQVKYLLAGKSKQFYFQQTDIIQAVYQYISYATDFDYRIITLQTPIEMLIQLPNYFFILVNNINILPQKLLQIKNTIIYSINTQLDKGFNLVLVFKILNTVLILLSMVVVVVYYKFIFKNYIMQVHKMYQNIKIEQIKLYQQKCNKYKNSLTSKPDNIQSNSKSSDQLQSNAFIHLLKDQNQQISAKGQQDKNQNEEDEQKKLIGRQQNTGNEQLLTFQSKPKIWKRVIKFLIWIAIYGTLLLIICFSYAKGTDLLEKHIMMLNNYSILQNSVVQMRFFSQLSLNMLNYWDENYVNLINTQLEMYFSTAIKYIDDPSLNFTHIKPEFARKYEEMRYIQSLVIDEDRQKLNVLAIQIQEQLEDMDSLIQFVSGQSDYYGPLVQSDASQIGATMNICIGLEFIFIFMYWYFGVRNTYYRLLKEHENTFQMYNIISYNLRKQIQKTE